MPSMSHGMALLAQEQAAKLVLLAGINLANEAVVADSD